jgi:hypothetical protein
MVCAHAVTGTTSYVLVQHVARRAQVTAKAPLCCAQPRKLVQFLEHERSSRQHTCQHPLPRAALPRAASQPLTPLRRANAVRVG